MKKVEAKKDDLFRTGRMLRRKFGKMKLINKKA